MRKETRIAIVGSKGALGHALTQVLSDFGYKNIIGIDLPEYDMSNRNSVDSFFEEYNPDVVFLLAAVVGGIDFRKKNPATILQTNIDIIANVFESAFRHGCKNIVNVCSALVYPSDAKMPYDEGAITHTELSCVDTPYSLPKAVSLELANGYNRQFHTNYITVIPTNFFGPFSPYTGDKAGVVPSLVNRFYDAKENEIPNVVVWGTGNACRDVLYSYDVAYGCLCALESKTNDFVFNISRGQEYPIREIAEIIKDIVGYQGQIVYDETKPEGRMHMMLDTSRIKETGWMPKYDMRESIKLYYKWMKDSLKSNTEVD